MGAFDHPMENLRRYFDLVGKFVGQERAVDVAHNLFLIGCLVARKPRHVLEMGMGTGFVTGSVIQALGFNGVGELTCVDNWHDWGGREPDGTQQIRAAGVRVVAPMDEERFLRSAPADAYDFVISDADHFRSHAWVDQYLRITAHDGFLFFHDTNNDLFPNLRAIVDRVGELNLPHYHFIESTRPDERCSRGWLFVINRKGVNQRFQS
ncbi:MAG: class I SAM-dependent methyltransferase [Pirellulales bacterium]